MLVAAYLRVSKDEQAEKDLSIPSQKSRIVAYCQSQDWEVYDFYVDDGYSAKNLDRPAMKRIIDDSKQKKFDAVVVIRLDRISRKQKDVLYLIEDVFEPSSVGFKSVTQPFDTTTAFGKAAIGMLAVFAQLERDQLIERVTDAKVEAAKQGRFMGGPVPYGYKHISGSKSVEIDEKESEIVRFIFRQYLTTGVGYQAIADTLTTNHISPPGGAKFWHRSTVNGMLHNAFYAGLIEHKGNFYKALHQPIVTEAQFYEAKGIQEQRSSYNPDAEAGLLKGIIYCGECGARMRLKKVYRNPRNPKGKVAYYVCYSQDGSEQSMIKDRACKCGYKRTDMIDDYVVHYIMKYSQNTNLFKEVAEKSLNNDSNKFIAKSLTQAQKEFDQIKKKIDRWYDAFENSDINSNDLFERVKELRERRLVLEGQISEYEAALTANDEKKLTIGHLCEILKNIRFTWSESSPTEQRALVHSMVNSVKVFKDDSIKIDFAVD
ncbi:recombinase family protein [Sporomusa sp.]|uniref:recombinase family protein n=1 Tax=Sporomusa sp. TaxID=2078658 RepID=UPI002D09FED3|nr:recombinase family protein [Sporomusa sp.]HWR09234.1 recombinase family protein [Sporomusa sp.]